MKNCIICNNKLTLTNTKDGNYLICEDNFTVHMWFFIDKINYWIKTSKYTIWAKLFPNEIVIMGEEINLHIKTKLDIMSFTNEQEINNKIDKIMLLK